MFSIAPETITIDELYVILKYKDDFTHSSIWKFSPKKVDLNDISIFIRLLEKVGQRASFAFRLRDLSRLRYSLFTSGVIHSAAFIGGQSVHSVLSYVSKF